MSAASVIRSRNRYRGTQDYRRRRNQCTLAIKRRKVLRRNCYEDAET